MGKQTTPPWTPHPSCIYPLQEQQWRGVPCGQECVQEPHLPQEGCACGTGHVSITGATR